MFRKIIKTFFTFLFICRSAYAIEIWNTEIGISRLNSSKYKNDFYQLANFFQAQTNPILCSAATALIIKNSLFYPQIPSQKISQITTPSGKDIAFNLYISQDDFFNNKTNTVKNKDVIYFQQKTQIQNIDGTTSLDYDPGLNLQDFAKILSIHKIRSKIFYQSSVDEKQILKFRELIKEILNDKTRFLIANFDGKVFGNKTNGHISPIVAFDEESDSVLVLDVALHKNPWYWVDLTQLIQAMNTLDGKQYRGYLIVSKWKL